MMEVLAPKCDAQHIKTRAPMTEVESYPALLEAIPGMKEDFFRSPLDEKVRKDVIYGFPKFIAMNYQPPPRNDSAPLSSQETRFNVL
ncbi:hypothetical protein AYI69_g605 [Smittium culicis]|uniref:Uncharacterized protein n=1 Tax=Smittium culicis TaxID=133412 RepID=A0A1R1YSJ0_9FUNG|nr:hypothetical protein AYI69_g605 [Smittium culicis]